MCFIARQANSRRPTRRTWRSSRSARIVLRSRILLGARLHRGAVAGDFPHLAVRQRVSAVGHSAALPDPRARRYRRKHSRRLLRPDLARQRRVHGHRRLFRLQAGDRCSYSACLAWLRDFDPAAARAAIHFARRARGGGCRNPLRYSQSADQGPLSGGRNARSAVLLRLGVPAGAVVHQLRALRVGQCTGTEFLRSDRCARRSSAICCA